MMLSTTADGSVTRIGHCVSHLAAKKFNSRKIPIQTRANGEIAVEAVWVATMSFSLLGLLRKRPAKIQYCTRL